MKSRGPVYLSVSISLAAAFGVTARANQTGVSSNTPKITSAEYITVSAADLIKTPERFSGHQVRVTGYWVLAFEQSSLSETDSPNKLPPIWVESFSMPGGREVKNPKAITAALESAYRAVGTNRRMKYDVLLVTLEGFFDHKSSIEPTEETRPFPNGFGHLGQYPSRLTIERVVEIKLVSEKDYPF